MKLVTPAVLRNTIYLFFLQVGNYIAPVVLLPLLTQRLSPAGYGDYAFVIACSAYAVLLVDWGFTLSATRMVSISRDDIAKVSEVFWDTFFAKATLSMGALLLGLVAVVVTNVPSGLLGVLAISLVFNVIGALFSPVFLFQGLEKMGRMTVVNISVKLLSLPLVWFFVQGPSDLFAALAINGVLGALAGMLNFAEALRIVKWKLPSVGGVSRALQAGGGVFLSTAAVSLYTNTTVVFLRALSGSVAVGYFVAAQSLIKAVCGLYGPVSQAIFPRVSLAFTEDPSRAAVMMGRYIKWQTLMGALISIATFVAAPMAVRMMFGAIYEPSIDMLRIMSPLPLLLALSNTFGIQVLLPVGDVRGFSRVLIQGGAVSLILTPVLAHFLGGDGASLSVLAVEFLIVSLMWVRILLVHKGLAEHLLPALNRFPRFKVTR